MIAAIGTIVIGLTVMAGWILDVDALRKLLPGARNPMAGTTGGEGTTITFTLPMAKERVSL